MRCHASIRFHESINHIFQVRYSRPAAASWSGSHHLVRVQVVSGSSGPQLDLIPRRCRHQDPLLIKPSLTGWLRRRGSGDHSGFVMRRSESGAGQMTTVWTECEYEYLK